MCPKHPGERGGGRGGVGGKGGEAEGELVVGVNDAKEAKVDFKFYRTSVRMRRHDGRR